MPLWSKRQVLSQLPPYKASALSGKYVHLLSTRVDFYAFAQCRNVPCFECVFKHFEFLIVEMLNVFLSVLVLLKRQIRVVFRAIITLTQCNCTKHAVYFPDQYYANVPITMRVSLILLLIYIPTQSETFLLFLLSIATPFMCSP